MIVLFGGGAPPQEPDEPDKPDDGGDEPAEGSPA
jgi:hypothetical protein